MSLTSSELPHRTPAPINIVSVSIADGPTLNTQYQPRQHLTPDTSTAQPGVTPEISPLQKPTPKTLMADRLETSSNAENLPFL